MEGAMQGRNGGRDGMGGRRDGIEGGIWGGMGWRGAVDWKEGAFTLSSVTGLCVWINKAH